LGPVVTGKTSLLRAQRRWADARGVRYDAYGCVRDLADNLRAPLAGAALAELERGSELTPYATRPARLYSLGSSAALVLNVFDFWRERDTSPLLQALDVAGDGAVRLKLEEPLPTGLPGDAPTADVLLELGGGRYVAIESKYAEWLVRRPRNKRVFKDKYFPAGAGQGVWSAAGLPRCQELAEDLQAGRQRPKYLHAPQLLKHALGLAHSGRRNSVLVYLYFDWPVREAETHRAEIERVVARLTPEIDLRVLTYQTLFASLRAAPGVDADYLDYLAQRYFR
ncbi:MAG TPA: hypothetical protein VM692_06735, partial [Gammaproteobacteria bacterium]|nr:hypothetical protein [Gammaproteobacteria bacterium]